MREKENKIGGEEVGRMGRSFGKEKENQSKYRVWKKKQKEEEK